MSDLTDRVKATMVALRELGVPSRHVHTVHDAAHALAAIDSLHRPLDDGEYGGVVCTTCVSGTWPCRTYQVLHPA